MMGTNTPHIKLVKEENTGQPTSYISEWISVIKTNHGRHIPYVAAVDPV